jgi:mannose-1-phosphate guanylyltransferase
MKALLLAAGMGSRLRPITDTVPKCMVPIMGRPLLDYWLDLLGPAEYCSEIVINTHHLPQPVREHVARSQYRGKITLVHENALLGTGGTLMANLPRLLGDDALVAHADNLTLFRLGDLLQAFEQRPAGCVATMMSFLTDSPQSCGILELDAEGVVQGFHEKVANPPGTLANAAVFVFSREALDTIATLDAAGVFEISVDIVPRLIGHMNTWQNTIYHRDIGNPAALAAAQTEFPSIYQAFHHKG